MTRRFTKYPSGYVRASKSWGKVSTNPEVATVLVDIAHMLKGHDKVESLDVKSNGDLYFDVAGHTYYLKVYKQ